MKFTATAVSTIALIGAAVAQQTSGDITVNTPASLVQCQPAAVSWSGGTAPYIVAVIPGGQASAAALTTISDAESGNSLTWTVNVKANTEVTIKLTDSKGAIQYSSPVTIQSGSSDSCLNASGGSSSAPSASGSSNSSSAAASGSPSSASGAASGASSAAPSSASGASRTTATSTAPTSTVTGSASGSAASSGASTPASSGASGSSAPSSSASSTGANSGALPNGIVAVPAVVFAALGAMVALF